MKIGIFDPYLDDAGGGEKYLGSIAEYLSKKHKISIFWNKKEDVLRVAERFVLDFSNVEIKDNIFSSNIGTIERLKKSKKYDVIIYLSDGSVPLVLSKKLFLHIQQPLGSFQNKTMIDKLKLSRVDEIFCNSQYTSTYLGKRFGIKSDIINPPVKIKKINIPKENIILHVGRFRLISKSPLNDYKKQVIMIEAFSKMIKNGLKHWKLLLAVSVKKENLNDFKRMKDLTKNLPIEFLVDTDNDQLWKYYSEAKIYWHASGYGENLEDYPELAEHFGISTVEAMGAGCVPVVINKGGQKEIIEDGKNGLLWDTLEQLENKTLEIIKDKKMWEELSKNAQDKAKIYNTSHFEEKIDQLIS